MQDKERTQALITYLCDQVASNPHPYLDDLDPLFMGGIIEEVLTRMGQTCQVLQISWEDSRGSVQDGRVVMVDTLGQMWAPYNEPSLKEAFLSQNPGTEMFPGAKFSSPYCQPNVLQAHIKQGTDLETLLFGLVDAGVSFWQSQDLEVATPHVSHSSHRRTL